MDAEILFLGPGDVAALLEPGALLEALAAAFAAAARGEVAAPPRTQVELPGGGGLLVMPGHRAGLPLVVKHVGMFEGNVARGLPHHPATICAFDEETGVLRAVVDATELTALRTAGAAALSVSLAARADARVAAVVGSGPVAEAHLGMLPAVRDFAEIRVAARSAPAAGALAARHGGVVRAAASIEEAVRGADVVCLCTGASEPVLAADRLGPGVHVSSVGYAPPGGELDPALARAGRLLVESRDAFAPPPAGCAELAGLDPDSAAELGEVVLGERPGRASDDELTVYKSMGTVIEDVAAAGVVLERAAALGAGRRVRL
jgi:ornithine cyclodeaminase/alanine dehydrogenase-like protein (mu-crystallin family)